MFLGGCSVARRFDCTGIRCCSWTSRHRHHAESAQSQGSLRLWACCIFCLSELKSTTCRCALVSPSGDIQNDTVVERSRRHFPFIFTLNGCLNGLLKWLVRFSQNACRGVEQSLSPSLPTTFQLKIRRVPLISSPTFRKPHSDKH